MLYFSILLIISKRDREFQKFHHQSLFISFLKYSSKSSVNCAFFLKSKVLSYTLWKNSTKLDFFPISYKKAQFYTRNWHFQSPFLDKEITGTASVRNLGNQQNTSRVTENLLIEFNTLSQRAAKREIGWGTSMSKLFLQTKITICQHNFQKRNCEYVVISSRV